ncbi:MAG: hypothetical protein P4L33_14465 [Capsulimonadaceae bacterium]|nr:hypothetical protein [Capsulimonadaceae bacterium]
MPGQAEARVRCSRTVKERYVVRLMGEWASLDQPSTAQPQRGSATDTQASVESSGGAAQGGSRDARSATQTTGQAGQTQNHSSAASCPAQGSDKPGDQAQRAQQPGDSGKKVDSTQPTARDISDEDKRRLHHLLDCAAQNGISAQDANQAVQAIKADMLKLPPGSPEPANLMAVRWALDHLGDKKFGKQSKLSIPGLETANNGSWKCNYFVAAAYGVGAGIGFGGKGYPVTKPILPWNHALHPEPAEALADPSEKKIGPFERVLGSHSSPPVSFHPGDIVAFEPSPWHYMGHATIGLGGDLLIYAGKNDVKLATVEQVWKDHVGGQVTVRRFIRHE